MTHYIISYDISNTPLRSKVAKLLERHGCERLQKSVFLAPNFDWNDLLKLKKLAKDMMISHSGKVSSDSLVCFPIKKSDIAEMVWEGDTQELRRILEEILFLLI